MRDGRAGITRGAAVCREGAGGAAAARRRTIEIARRAGVQAVGDRRARSTRRAATHRVIAEGADAAGRHAGRVAQQDRVKAVHNRRAGVAGGGAVRREVTGVAGVTGRQTGGVTPLRRVRAVGDRWARVARGTAAGWEEARIAERALRVAVARAQQKARSAIRDRGAGGTGARQVHIKPVVAGVAERIGRARIAIRVGARRRRWSRPTQSRDDNTERA